MRHPLDHPAIPAPAGETFTEYMRREAVQRLDALGLDVALVNDPARQTPERIHWMWLILAPASDVLRWAETLPEAAQ